MSDTILSLKNIVRVYNQGDRALKVLDQLNFEVKAGEMIALVGPSGSGKTTLLQIAGLLDTPTSGEVTINDQNVTGANDARRTASRLKHIGFVYQFHHLLREFTALENVALPQMVAGTSSSLASSKAKALLEELGLRERLHHRPAKLSGGEQQRVAIARTLANDPLLLLADEPTGNLDHHTAEQVFTLLVQTVRQRKLAALIATHNLDLARRMDKVVKMEDGVLKPL